MIYEKLCEILEDIFDLDEGLITPETSFIDTLGADQQDLTEMAMIIEEEFDITVDEEEFADILTVEDMVQDIKEKSE